MAFRITSPAFDHHGPIPPEFTCDGGDTSPPLQWSGTPNGARSLALIVDDPDAPDPDAPRRTYVHWILYDIPPSTFGLEAGQGSPAGARPGTNDWRRTDYGGPCPPIGRHRYFFKLYALDRLLGDRGALSKAELEREMNGHILASTELVGTYQRRAKEEGR
jgi:Raf kinase inhibitor-like YbhB/YbcL family protein